MDGRTDRQHGRDEDKTNRNKPGNSTYNNYVSASQYHYIYYKLFHTIVGERRTEKFLTHIDQGNDRSTHLWHSLG